MKSLQRVRSSRKKKNAPIPLRTVKTPTGLWTNDSSITFFSIKEAVGWATHSTLLRAGLFAHAASQVLQVIIVNSPSLKEISFTRMRLMFFSSSSLSTSIKIFGYSSLMYAGNLS